MPKPLSVEIINLSETLRYLERMPEETFDDAHDAFQVAVLAADAQVKGNFGGKLQVRTGTLRRSIQTSVEGTDLRTLDARIYGAKFAGGEQLVYTLTQEFGATIKAKRAYKGVPGGPYLNIPLAANKTAAGVQRMSAREVFGAGGYIRGRAVFSHDDKAMFALVKEVKVRPALGMIEAAEDQVPTILSTLQRRVGDY